MSKYFLSIDLGTQGTKAAILDARLCVCAESFEKSNLISPKPGIIWQEPQEIVDSVQHTVKNVLEKSGIDSSNIVGVGVAGQMAGIIGIKSDGSAATYYDSWLDTRCERYVKLMREKAGKQITEITGGPVTYSHGPKILWWKHEQPNIYAQVYKFVTLHTYVVMQMCGLTGEDAYFDYTCLHFSGFGDNLRKEWSNQLLNLFDVDPNKMARIVSPFEIIGSITEDFASLSGLQQGTPVVAGLGDTAASTFGSGMVKKGILQDCAGTASVLCTVMDEYKPDIENETLIQMRSPIDGLWLPLSYINGGGLCIRWFRDCLTGTPPDTYDVLQCEASEIAPGSEGIIFVPHFSGRVLPQNPYMKGCFVGLDWKHNRAHMYRAIMEGIGYEYSYYLSVLKILFPYQEFERIYTIGGGAQSDLFNQIKSDILGLPVATLKTGETALVGCAVIAGVACGVFHDYSEPLEQIMVEEKKYFPDSKNHQTYKPFAAEYLNVLLALESIYKSKIYKIRDENLEVVL